jgi:hypothetical protein
MTSVLPVASIAAIFVGLLLSRADFVPIFDGRIYADCVVDAAQSHLAPSKLQCAGHPDYAFMLLTALPQLVRPASFVPMLCAAALLGVVGICAFGAALGVLFPGPERRHERWLLTAAMAFNPVIVASFVNVNPDDGVLAFFLVCIWATVSRREGVLVASGVMLCFCKEGGALLYALLVGVHLWLDASRAPGGLREKLGALRPAIRLSAPLVAFAGALAARTVFSQPVLWKGESHGGESHGAVWAQLLSFQIDDPAFHQYLAGIFATHFQWMAALVVAPYLATALARRLLLLPDADASSDAARGRTFAAVTFVATLYLLTRYHTYADPRYWMPVYPALLLVLAPAMEWAVRAAIVRRVALGAFILLVALSNFATFDPVAKRVLGTFPFGRHRMLAMTSISDECCGFGRDQLVYNLEALEIHYALSRVFARIRPTDATEIAVAPEADWFTLGPLDPATFERTLSREGAILPRYHDLEEVAERPEPPAELYFVSMPNIECRRCTRWLSTHYGAVEKYRVGHDGYEMDVLHLTMPTTAAH